jgi:hypothetical protein
MKKKGRYFSVRFSAALLERLHVVRRDVFGERTSLAETIRRLLEDHLCGLPCGTHPDKTTKPQRGNVPTSLVSPPYLSESTVDAMLSSRRLGSLSSPEARAVRALSREVIRLGVAIERLTENAEVENSSQSSSV